MLTSTLIIVTEADSRTFLVKIIWNHDSVTAGKSHMCVCACKYMIFIGCVCVCVCYTSTRQVPPKMSDVVAADGYVVSDFFRITHF